MRESKISEISRLKKYSLDKLKARYRELFGQDSETTSRAYLIRLIAYRLQEQKLGPLSKVVQTKIDELIRKYDPINNKVFRPDGPASKRKTGRDRRLPIAGTEIIKTYKGKQYVVKVKEKGFELEDKTYRTLSRVAEEITGVHWSGYTFFNL